MNKQSQQPQTKNITVTSMTATTAEDYDMWPGDTVKSLATGNVYRMTSEGKLERISGTGLVTERVGTAAEAGVLDTSWMVDC